MISILEQVNAIDIQSKDGDTLLMMAARNGLTDVVYELHWLVLGWKSSESLRIRKVSIKYRELIIQILSFMEESNYYRCFPNRAVTKDDFIAALAFTNSL